MGATWGKWRDKDSRVLLGARDDSTNGSNNEENEEKTKEIHEERLSLRNPFFLAGWNCARDAIQAWTNQTMALSSE